MLLALMNVLFFGSILVVVAFFERTLPPPLVLNVRSPFLEELFNGDPFVSAFAILIFDLFFSAFVFVMLLSVAFFPLSIGFLLFRAFIWGSLLYSQPTWTLLVAIPTVILQGEAYALAALTGLLVGLSWIKPEWVYRGKSLTRREAFNKSLEEYRMFYVFAIMFMVAGAITETVALMVMH